LALAIFVLAVANLALVFALFDALTSTSTSFCRPPHGWYGMTTTWYGVAEKVCAQPSLVSAALGDIAATLTVLLLIKPLRRGLEDVGFVPESLRAARRRTVGL
jgi:hypothetical protein